MVTIKTQLAVIGGGPAGVCAALAAARRGIRTVLVTNRPMLGGNSSSEIRVWSRGAVGGGNLYAEEMGIWGELRLTNFFSNPDGNPVFWDEVLLDAVLAEPLLTLWLNTDVSAIESSGSRICAVSGYQQGTEKQLRLEGDVFLDATGDGTLGKLAGVPYYMGDTFVPAGGAEPETPELLGCSILFFTKRDDHPVSFKAPRYAYSMEQVASIVNRGGRIANEKMSGSDCWWFEYGGELDTIDRLQDIGLELKRLVMGIWNYIKNSGEYDADYYTLEWVGSIPGKRESRRMATEYLLTEQDVREGTRFDDGAFYGGWYLDTHPAEGVTSDADGCVQIGVNVYQIPLRCLYSRQAENLLFAGRNIGIQRQAFVSSRVMNTCALAGQAAGELAAAMLDSGKAPWELTAQKIERIRILLEREDMFIPGAEIVDPDDLARSASVSASSFHAGGWGAEQGALAVTGNVFVCFPGAEDETAVMEVVADAPTVLRGSWALSSLPNRLCPGHSAGTDEWQVRAGRNTIRLTPPARSAGQICTILLEDAPGVEIVCSAPGRTGFLCGQQGSPFYREPRLQYEKGMSFYLPERAVTGPSRVWGAPNQWLAAENDETPWLELRWDEVQAIRQIRLYLDPDLNGELPSSRARHWQESHLFVPREGMPVHLIRDASVSVQGRDGIWRTAAVLRDNCQRLAVIRLPEVVQVHAVRLTAERTWGGTVAVYRVSVYGENV